MGKYKIIIEDIKLDGIDIEKDSVVQLPWQIGESYITRGWAEKVGEDDDIDTGGGKKVSKNRSR